MQLYPYQEDGVKQILRKPMCLLCDDMGLGKTAQVITALKRRNKFPCVIVAPSALKVNWKREIEVWANETTEIDNINQKWIIINYERLEKHYDELINRNFQTIVFDEGHCLKEFDSKRTKYAKLLATFATYKILITGTPIVNRPKELCCLLDVVGLIKYFGGVQNFLNRYCRPARTRYGMTYDGFSNIDELKNRMNNIWIRRTKEQVGLTLPNKTVNMVAVDTVPQQKPRSFEDIQNYEDENLNIKIKKAIPFINNLLDEHKKVVVFVHKKETVRELLQYFPNASIIVGAQSTTTRQENIDNFQNKDTQLIICSLQASACGLTLTASHTAVFLEYLWSPSIVAQAEDRIHRLSQKNDCTVYKLVTEDSIDGFRLTKHRYKKAYIDYIVK